MHDATPDPASPRGRTAGATMTFGGRLTRPSVDRPSWRGYLTRVALCLGLLSATGVHDVLAQDAGGPDRVEATLTQADVGAFLDAFVPEQIQRRRIAGAVVTVVKDGAVLASAGYGLADVAAARAIRPETPVRIGSITKTLTALAVMQLVEQKRLDLDTDVTRSLDFAVPAPPGRPAVTLRRLLSHRTGFEDRRGGIGAWSGNRLPLGPYLARHLPPRLRQPDEVVAYSNVNASLAAYIVERASGRRFESYLAERIFQPLQMAATTAEQPPPEPIRSQVPNGYSAAHLPPTPVSMATATIHEVGSTGVVSSAADMGTLMIALLEADPRLLSRTSLDSMMTGQAAVPYGVIGLGLYAPVADGGHPFIGHDGDTGGFHATMALLPQDGFGLFVSYNSDGIPEPRSARGELLQQIAARYFAGTTLPAPVAPGGGVGVYQPARRVESNLFGLRSLIEQIAVQPVNGTLHVRPAIVPASEPLQEIEPGLFRWRGRDVSFAGSGAAAVMQIGSPVVSFVPVPWWGRAGVALPAMIVCLIVSALAVLSWPIAVLRHRRVQADRVARRLNAATRLALLLFLAAIGTAFWLVLWGWPLVAVSSPVVRPLAFGIHAAAWAAVALTPLTVWRAVRMTRPPADGWLALGRAWLLAAAALVLAVCCLYWRIAGTTLDLG